MDAVIVAGRRGEAEHASRCSFIVALSIDMLQIGQLMLLGARRNAFSEATVVEEDDTTISQTSKCLLIDRMEMCLEQTGHSTKADVAFDSSS